MARPPSSIDDCAIRSEMLISGPRGQISAHRNRRESMEHSASRDVHESLDKHCVELCDSSDNNCNGTNNEGFPGLNDACDGPDSDLCEEGTTVCSADGTQTVCTDSSGSSVEICNGLDDDCDESTDEGQLCPAGQRCFQAACVCDGTSCPGGCCDVARACRTPPTRSFCGTGGAACFNCGNRADSCNDDGCRCGGGPACGGTLRCCDGQCRDPATC